MPLTTTRKTLFSSFLTISMGVAGAAQAEGPTWLWSEESRHSRAGAAALSDGDYGRGVRLMHRALEVSVDKRSQLIAHHNLCVAYSAKQRTRAAQRHCQTAERLADDGFVVANHTPLTSAADVLAINLTRVGAR